MTLEYDGRADRLDRLFYPDGILLSQWLARLNPIQQPNQLRWFDTMCFDRIHIFFK